MQRLLLNILKKEKDKIIYKINNESITYDECYKRVIELASNLKKQGNKSVIIYGQKSIEDFISILACVIAKRCYIPIDICTPIERIKEIILESKASLIIKNKNIELDNIEILTIKAINNKYKLINHGSVNENNNAYIIFTSGSTGSSKGVPITYDNLNHFIKWITDLEEFNNCNNLNILSQASFSFDLSVMDIYFSIFKRSTIIAVDKDTKENLLNLYNVIKKEKINFLIMTPTFVKILLLDKSFNDSNFSNIKYMFFCGECLEITTVRKIKERFRNVKVINAYGPTEATCCVSLVEINNGMLESEYLPVGVVDTASVKIEIINGEIVLKGSSVFSGYLGIDKDTYYKENNINCYNTGDLGKIKSNFLYCNGRKDNQVKYKGYRIELGDIENNLLKIKGIKEAVVISKNIENTNIVKLIKAFVVVDKNINESIIKEKLKLLLPDYMIPKKIIILDKIPVNNNGKYDRKKLTLL